MANVAAVTTAGAGVLPAATGVGDSVEGLFAALMGGAQSVGSSEGIVITQIAQAQVDGVSTAGQTNLASQTVQLGEDTLNLVGEDSVVIAFMDKLQDVFLQMAQQGIQFGKSKDNQELQAALIQLGMDPQAAELMAARIETMTKLLEQQQASAAEDSTHAGENDEVTDGSTQMALMALMVAAVQVQQGQVQQGPVSGDSDAAAAVTGQAFKLQITMVQTTRLEVKVVKTATAGYGTSQASDIVRGLLTGKTEEIADGDAVKDISVVQQKTDDTKELVVQVEAAEEAGTAQITVTLPAQDVAKTKEDVAADVAAVASKMANGAVDSQAEVSSAVVAAAASAVAKVAPAAEQVARQVEKVSTDKILDKPKGEVMYKWSADDLGREMVQAVQPANGSEASATLSQAAAQAGGLLAQQAGGQAVAATTSFAEALSKAAKADVAGQVVIQMKPLAENGGGTVRMVLNPPELGEVQVEITVKEGRVHGAIAASNPAVVENLARELHSLRHGLAEAGMKLGEQGINLMLSSNDSFSQQQGQSQQQAFSGRTWSANETETAQAEPIAATWAAPERVLDVRV